MNLLLDTHVLLWWLADSGQIAGEPAEAIERADQIWVSAASVWEIEIKRAKGKLISPDDLRWQLAEAGFRELKISAEHAEEAARLPDQHNDPFDRMLIAQARIEGLVLMTSDEAILRYQVSTHRLGAD